jgi:short-subunit dehydrogenase
MELKNKFMLITGASSGIVAATAKAAARAGMRVALVTRSQANLDKVAVDIRQMAGGVSS